MTNGERKAIARLRQMSEDLARIEEMYDDVIDWSMEEPSKFHAYRLQAIDRVRLDLSERFMEAVHDYADIFGHHPRIEGDPICLGLMVKFEDGKAMVLDRHKFLNYIKEKLPEGCPYTRTCFIGKEEA